MSKKEELGRANGAKSQHFTLQSMQPLLYFTDIPLYSSLVSFASWPYFCAWAITRFTSKAFVPNQSPPDEPLIRKNEAQKKMTIMKWNQPNKVYHSCDQLIWVWPGPWIVWSHGIWPHGVTSDCNDSFHHWFEIIKIFRRLRLVHRGASFWHLQEDNRDNEQRL